MRWCVEQVEQVESPAMTNLCVYGLSEEHLGTWENARLHKSVIADVASLKEAASRAGFELGIASGFRSFERQRVIWNAKARGERPTLDDRECPIDLGNLSDHEKLEKILRWSAVPGGSRHHWGTDFDVYDAGVVNTTGYQLQLTVAETRDSGPFADFYKWLDEYLSAHPKRFFRPYAKERGGVAIEPWHLSHVNQSLTIQKQFNLDELRGILGSIDIALKESLLEHLDDIYARFIRVD